LDLEITNYLWVEKYRPKELKDVVLPEEYRKDFEINIRSGEIGNLLFAGPPGSGKTAVSMIICSKNGIIQNRNDNVLEINGSAKDTRGISYVQDVIEPYLRVPPAPPDKYKVVFIDESDALTSAFFDSIKHIIEKYSKYGRFIFTCNYISKIPDAVQSRFQCYMFRQMPLEFVEKYCKNILTKEEIEFNEKDLKYIIDNLYPDIRKIINSLQRRSSTKKLIIDKNSVLTSERIIISNLIEIIGFIQDGEDHKINNVINNIVKLLGEVDLDFRSVYSDLFYRHEVPTTAKIIINKYSNNHNDCLIVSMNFMAMVFEIIQGLQKYKQMVSKK